MYDLQRDFSTVAASRHGHGAVEERHAEIKVHLPRAVEETIDIGVVERLDADPVRTGREPANRKLSLRVQREASDHGPGRRIECDHVRAKQRLAVLGYSA